MHSGYGDVLRKSHWAIGQTIKGLLLWACRDFSNAWGMVYGVGSVISTAAWRVFRHSCALYRAVWHIARRMAVLGSIDTNHKNGRLVFWSCYAQPTATQALSTARGCSCVQCQ
jgi:hypothetical protein